MRVISDEGESVVVAQAICITVEHGDCKTMLAGVIAGSVLFVLCDHFPLQNWLAENRKTFLARITEAYQPVTVLKIYSDSHK